MHQKNFLFIIRCFCIGQFIVVLLLVLHGSVSKTEMVYVMLSAAFGLILDGFSHTILKTAVISREKAKLDIELDQLMKDFSKNVEDKKGD